MEQEVIGIINMLKEANEFIYPAALQAAKVAAYMEVFIGLGVVMVMALCICLFYKRLKEEDMQVPAIVGGVFFSFIAFLFVVLGIYELSTLEYQAFKMIIHGV